MRTLECLQGLWEHMDSAGVLVSFLREMQKSYNEAKAVKSYGDQSSGPVAGTGSTRGPRTHTHNQPWPTPKMAGETLPLTKSPQYLPLRNLNTMLILKEKY